MQMAATLLLVARALALLGPGVLWAAALDEPFAWFEAPVAAAAFWIVEFWWQRPTPFDWTRSSCTLAIAAWLLAALLLRRRKGNHFPPRGALALWGFAALLWTAIALFHLVPPGVDGAMHSGVARALADSSGHPTSFLPVWSLPFFHSYPVGQPTLVALLQLVSGSEWRTAALAGHALSYALLLGAFSCAIGLACDRGGGLDDPSRVRGVALGAALLLVSRAPFSYWTWGGAPNALSFGLATLAVCAGLRLHRAGRPADALRLALFGAASLLTHAIAPIGYAWILAPLLCASLLARGRARTPLFLLALGLGLLLLAPYLRELHSVLDADEAAWVASTSKAVLARGVFALLPASLHDVPLLLGGAALVALALLQRRALLLPLWMIGVTLLLIANGSRSLLPLSSALYPDRLPLLLLLPIALLLWSALELLAPRLRAGWMRQAALGAALLLAVHAVDLQRKLVDNGREHELLTPDDLALLARETPQLVPGCFVANNYGDGGQWIPALFDRPITLPQVNVIWFSEMPLRAHPCAAFRGARLAYSIDSVTPLCRAANCHEVAHQGAAAWFAVTDPALLVEARGAR